jgi:hypothetical protein
VDYDVFLILLDYLEIENPIVGELPGCSFAALLRGEANKGNENIVIFDEYGPVRMIRSKEWKYVHRYPYGPHELYDLVNDPKLYSTGEYRDSLMSARRALENLSDKAWYHYGKHCDKSDSLISVSRRAPNQPWDLRSLAENLKSKFNKSNADIPNKDPQIQNASATLVILYFFF